MTEIESMYPTQSISQFSILLVFTILSLSLACLIARHPQRPAFGIALGVFCGLVLQITASVIVGFMGNVIPFGQIDFWLGSLLNRMVQGL